MTEEKDGNQRNESNSDPTIETVRDISLGNASLEDYSAPDTEPVSEHSIPELMNKLESPDGPTRRRAALALPERDPEESVVEKLESLAKTDPDKEVRQFAIEAVAKLGGDPEVARYQLETDSDPWVRAEAAVALDRLAREEYEEYFEQLLDDNSSGVRRNALISLTRLRGPAARDELIDGLEDPDDRVREWAAKLLGTIEDDPEVEKALKSVLEDEDELGVVKETAARSLGARGTEIDSLVDGSDGSELAGNHLLNQAPDR